MKLLITQRNDVQRRKRIEKAKKKEQEAERKKKEAERKRIEKAKKKTRAINYEQVAARHCFFNNLSTIEQSAIKNNGPLILELKPDMSIPLANLHMYITNNKKIWAGIQNAKKNRGKYCHSQKWCVCVNSKNIICGFMFVIKL